MCQELYRISVFKCLAVNRIIIKKASRRVGNVFNVLKECKNPLVSESGIRNKSDINFILKKTGIKNFLVGESLLKSSSIKKGLKELLK